MDRTAFPVSAIPEEPFPSSDRFSIPRDSHEVNLATGPGVVISVSPIKPTGSGSRDPRVLLQELFEQAGDGLSASLLDQSKTYDTYDGQNAAAGPDWYMIQFPETTTFNCIEMTMGLPYRDGGWWTSLAVETRSDESKAWQPVTDLEITPPYDFTDSRGTRRPFETHVLSFATISARMLRLIGRPGGVAEFTSLARLAVYRRDFSRWCKIDIPAAPTPYLFRLIDPNVLWDLSQSLVKLTGLTVDLAGMEYYLDQTRYQQYRQTVGPLYQGAPDLWFLMGNVMGWITWSKLLAESAELLGDSPVDPHVTVSFHRTLAQARAPIIVDGHTVGTMTSRYALLADANFDWDWHQHFAQQHQVDWSDYLAAIERSPRMTLKQLEGMADLMGMIANTIANLAHHNLHIEQKLSALENMKTARDQSTYLIRRAIEFMQDNLEESITVADVARAVALSPAYFCTLFAQETGRTPGNYLIDLRIARAKEYLAHTRMSVMDVCTALGYTPSYFSRLFKSRTGYTPGGYARHMRGDPA
ncbi:MAG TPA: AraC family transcriptional regulator [Spirillospora sp.]|nr:AraC family transcriptional regulator [Spirillospora sp.]